ncbi:MAG: class I SAM-dependent methyltransferase [Anaerolineae bacterium]|nr:class I SAM-dependent methyltransferase [Anaerolineae bacterium]
MTEDLHSILMEQKAYYQARAQEYDDWFYRRENYDRGPEHTQQWQTEINEVCHALQKANLGGHIVDIAAGTGIWTHELLSLADHITAIDSSQEMLELNRSRLQSNKVTYVLTDLFYWQPVMAYDAAFMGFWLSHVPPSQLYEFIGTLVGALKPEGKIFFVDSLLKPSATARGQTQDLILREQAAGLGKSRQITIRRRLSNNREFEIVKVFYDPHELVERFGAHNIPVTVKKTDNFFLYGWGTKMPED